MSLILRWSGRAAAGLILLALAAAILLWAAVWWTLPSRAGRLVLPGLTGLWQVEARDNPSFHAYRHLDLFYIENRSLVLDLTIIALTPATVAASRFLVALWATRLTSISLDSV